MNAVAKVGKPIIRARAEHCISRRDIDPDALKVLYRLIRRGHIAYLVGGGVRDLLLGRHPKDFDVSTDASPSQIKKQFRNCFLIGRRFRLAHIKYGDKIIETSTFRAQPNNDGDDLLQTDDNEFGNPEEDALRRDFTINGLFYDIETFSVIDYVGGLQDLDRKLVHCIGDPEIRFQEDPVRMMRAVRFASRLGFTIEENTFAAIIKHAGEIDKASTPRVLEEIFRLYAYGSARAAFSLLWQTGMMKIILPEIADSLEAEEDAMASPLWSYLEALDRGDISVKTAGHSLMLAALIFPILLRKINKPDSGITQRGLSEYYRKMVEPLVERLKVPRRMREKLENLIMAQYRFFNKSSKSFSKERFSRQEWFADALALYEIHLTAGGKDFFRANEWRNLLEASLEEEEETGSDNGEGSSPSKRRRRGRRGGRRRNKNRVNEDGSISESTGNETEQNMESNTMPPAPQTKPAENTAAKTITPQTTQEKNPPEIDGNINAAQPAAANDTNNQPENSSDEQTTKKRKRRRRRKKKPVNGEETQDQQANVSENNDVKPVADNRPQPAPAPVSQPAAPAAPITALDIMKKTTEEKKNKKNPRRRDRNKAIIPDNRPADAIPAFDRQSQAPHWLDEI